MVPCPTFVTSRIRNQMMLEDVSADQGLPLYPATLIQHILLNIRTVTRGSLEMFFPPPIRQG